MLAAGRAGVMISARKLIHAMARKRAPRHWEETRRGIREIATDVRPLSHETHMVALRIAPQRHGAQTSRAPKRKRPSVLANGVGQFYRRAKVGTGRRGYRDETPTYPSTAIDRAFVQTDACPRPLEVRRQR